MKTGIIRATLNDLAKVLGLSGEEQVSDALKSERAFKMSRRGLFVSAGALVAGKVFSIPNPTYLGVDELFSMVMVFSESNGIWTSDGIWTSGWMKWEMM